MRRLLLLLLLVTIPGNLLAPGDGSLNVKDFGALGDGSHDDTAAIQAAIDATGAYGGIVNIPPGSYKITRTILVAAMGASPKYSSLWLRGSGQNYGSQLSWYGDALSPMVQVGHPAMVYGSTYHKFTDFTLQGAGPAIPTAGVLITGAPNGAATGVTNSRFERLVIQRVKVGIQVGDATNPNVAENFFREIQVNGATGSGIVIQGNVTGNNHFYDCAVAYSARYGVEVLGGAGADFTNVAWNGQNSLGQLHYDNIGGAAINITGGHAELVTPFLVTDVEIGGQSVFKSVINIVGLTLTDGGGFPAGGDIIRYNGSGALVFIGGRFNVNGKIRVNNAGSWPNPTVIEQGLMLDGGAVNLFGSSVAYWVLNPVAGGGGSPLIHTNIGTGMGAVNPVSKRKWK